MKVLNFYLLVFLISLISISQSLNAQRIGIGTTSPNTSAQLDIVSTNKGLLIPRMTSIQRNVIASPANGLMIYDTDKNALYHYDGSSWRMLLNSEFWTRILSNRSRITNMVDSVGIGIAGPTERLDVVGNIHTWGDILADDDVVATGSVIGNGVTSTGDIIATGNGLFSGDITSFSNMVINNSTATLSLKNSGDKGFVQLSGDDLRIGTYSTNATGKFIVRTGGSNNFIVNSSGNVGIGTESPAAHVHINSGTSATTLRLQNDNSPVLSFYQGNTFVGSLFATTELMHLQAPSKILRLNNTLVVDGSTFYVGIGTSTPEQKLHVVGNVKVGTGKIYNSDDQNMLPIAYALYGADGTKISGSPGLDGYYIDDVFYLYLDGVNISNAICSITVRTSQLIASYKANADGIAINFWDGDSNHYKSGFSIVIYKTN